MNERIQPYFDYPKCRIIFDGRPLGTYPRITGSDSARGHSGNFSEFMFNN